MDWARQEKKIQKAGVEKKKEEKKLVGVHKILCNNY